MIRPDAARLPTTRAAGAVLALGAATISGVAVFLNGYAVQRVPSASVYTTAKNGVAAVILVLVATTLSRGEVRRGVRALDGRRAAALAGVGVLGGGVAFILFFEGLRHASSTQAAFLQKTLVVWVALLAVPLLRERLAPRHLVAIGALVAGQAWLSGDVSTLQRGGAGELMVLGATLIWTVEVVVVRALLSAAPSQLVGAARLGIGLPVLGGYLALSGQLGGLVHLDAAGWSMALLTGVVLAAYVATWFAALARAPAIDVTAILVAGAFITALLDVGVHHVALAPHLLGLVLVVAGAAAFVVPGRRPRPVPEAVTA